MTGIKKIFKVFFYCTGVSSLNLIMQVIAVIPLAVFIMLVHIGPSLLSGDPGAFLTFDVEGYTRIILLPAVLLAGFLTFGTVWLIHVLFKKPFFERLSFKKTPLLFIAVSFIIGCSMQLPINFILYQIEKAGIAPDLFEQYAKIIEPLMVDQNLVMMILAVGILTPILEEIVFRGLVFHQLRKNIPIVPAVILQALLFGLVHMNLIQGAYAFALGILMALTMIWSRSLLLPIAIHIGMNLSAVLLSEFGKGISDLAGNIMLLISCILIPAGMVFLYLKTKKNQYASDKEDPAELKETL